MIIYTGIDSYWTGDGSPYDLLEIDIGDNARLLVKPESFNRASVVKLVSSDPQLFLRPEYQPGCEIELSMARTKTSPSLI